MLLVCPACATEGWFALEELARALRCGRCLREFGFPSSSPPNKKWAYRTQGPFALSGYAKGAYATLFTLRCLGPTHDAEMTWFPGCEIGPESSKYELDFVAFWRKRWGRQSQVRVLMGECKTFDTFKPKEMRRFRELARRFPDAVRVFATLREELGQDEKIAIASLAREGRKPSGSRSPVLVLTAAESLSTSRPPHCYEGAGPRLEKFKKYNVTHGRRRRTPWPLRPDSAISISGMEPMSATFSREIRKAASPGGDAHQQARSELGAVVRPMSWRNPVAGLRSASETRSDFSDLEARSTGLEPVTSGVTGRRSNQLN